MLYYLFELLDKYNMPGAGLFSYISFRSALALISSTLQRRMHAPSSPGHQAVTVTVAPIRTATLIQTVT